MEVCFPELVSHKCICATLIPIRFTLKINLYVEVIPFVFIELYPYSDFIKVLTLNNLKRKKLTHLSIRRTAEQIKTRNHVINICLVWPSWVPDLKF